MALEARTHGHHGRSDDRDKQEQRALRSIEAINAGANIDDEAFRLANEFTDRHTSRFTAWLERGRRSERNASGRPLP